MKHLINIVITSNRICQTIDIYTSTNLTNQYNLNTIIINYHMHTPFKFYIKT